MPNTTDTVMQKNNKRKSHDILPKLLCVVAAFILWLYVTQVETSDYEETFNGITVELINTSVMEDETGLHVYNGRGNTVNVTVSGKRSDINRYTSDNISVVADVSEIDKPGRHTIPITVETPSEIKVSGTSVSSIHVYVDESASLDLDIRPKVVSGVFSDCELGEISPEYSVVNVKGPKTVIDNISHAQVSLSLGTVKSSVSTIGAIELVSKNGEEIDMRYVELDRDEVKVLVPVYSTKTVPFKVDYMHGYYNSNNVNITCDPPSVEIKGDPVFLENVDAISLGTVDETSITSDTTQVYLVKLPDGIRAVDNVETVSVSITHKGTVTQTFSVDKIKVAGADKKKVEVETKSLSVKVRGTKSELAKIKAEDISVTVDLSEYTGAVSGNVTVNATVSIEGASGNLYPVGQYPVKVRIG